MVDCQNTKSQDNQGNMMFFRNENSVFAYSEENELKRVDVRLIGIGVDHLDALYFIKRQIDDAIFNQRMYKQSLPSAVTTDETDDQSLPPGVTFDPEVIAEASINIHTPIPADDQPDEREVPHDHPHHGC